MGVERDCERSYAAAMLVQFRGALLVVRLALIGLGVGMSIGSQLGPGLPWFTVFPGLLVVAFGIATSRRLAMDGGALQVQTLLGSSRLRPGAAFGYRTVTRGRTAAIIVYATDGETELEIMELLPLGTARAERIVAKLTSVVSQAQVGPGVRGPSLEARNAVQQDRDQMAATQATIDAYYASPQHRRTTLILGLLIGTFVVTMSVLLALGVME